MPPMSDQWSKIICGNAWPPVLERRSAVKPKDSMTGRLAWARAAGVSGVPDHAAATGP